jgi:hypothetical protein
MYVMKRQHNFFTACSTAGGDMHADFDWSYDGLRNRMCDKAGLNAKQTTNGSVRSFVSNKLGKGGLAITENKQYYKASRKADKKLVTRKTSRAILCSPGLAHLPRNQGVVYTVLMGQRGRST